MAGMMITLIDVPTDDPRAVATAPRSLRTGRRPAVHLQDRDWCAHGGPAKDEPAEQPPGALGPRHPAHGRLGRLLDLHRHPQKAQPKTSTATRRSGV